MGGDAANTQMQRRARKWRALFAAALIAVLAALLWQKGWLPGGPDSAATPGTGAGQSGQRPPGAGRGNQISVSVTEAVVDKRDITLSLQALGTVTSSSTVTVRPLVSGQLLSVDFAEGQSVHQGDILAEIDPRSFQAALDQAKAQLARDQALLDAARVDLKRYQDLAQQNAVPRQTLDTQTALTRQYEATLAADAAEVQTAEINLGYTKIRAPVDGRAGLRQVDAGNYVTPSDTNGIVTLTRLRDISVLFSVPEDRLPQIAARLHAGATLPVDAYDRDGRIRLAQGTVTSFDSAIDTATGTIRFRATFPNTNGALFPNQFVNVTLDIDTLHDALTLPQAAIQRGVPGTFVFVIGADMSVKMQPVKLGASAGDRVQILDGLSASERVVLDGADRLRDGLSVTVRDPAAQSETGSGSKPDKPAP